MARHVTGSDLSGRVLLITGASSGIGAHFAKAAAAAGANVVLGARRTDLLAEIVAEIEVAVLGVAILDLAIGIRAEQLLDAAHG